MDKNEILNSDWEVRAKVAENPNTPADVLTELAKDSDWEVRAKVAENPNTPADVLMKWQSQVTLLSARMRQKIKFKEVFNR